MKLQNWCIVAMLILFSTAHSQNWIEKMNDPNATFKEVQDAFNAEWKNKPYKKGHGYKQFKRWEYLWGSRLDENGNLPPADFLIKEQKRYRASRAHMKVAAAGNWSIIDPVNVTELKDGIGRVNCMTANPQNPNILWAGTPAGGLWKSTDGGQNWTAKTDHLASLGISGIVIDHNNSNIMYIATGDADGGHTKSIGVLKSTDEGNTWDPTGFTQTPTIHDIKMHPTNSQIIFIGTSSGTYRTLDAGATWKKVHSLIRSYDIEFHPTNPQIIYSSSIKKIHKSVDGGTTWNQLTNGLPTDIGLFGKIELAVTKAKPNYIYALVAKSSSSAKGVYRSTDSGATFSARTTNIGFLGNQLGYDLAITGSPTNAEEIFIGGVEAYKSTNGGQTYSTIGSAATPGAGTLHVDHHNFHWTGNTLYSCNDGGLYKSTDNGAGWTLLGNGMDITQYYRVSTSKYDYTYLSAGAQDNGTSRLQNGVWKKINEGDGMNTIIDYNNPDIIYSSRQNGAGPDKSINSGDNYERVKGNITESGPWVTPYIQDHKTPNTLYAGFKNVWKTTQGGYQWTKLTNFTDAHHIYDIAQSESNLNILWMCRGSKIYKTLDGGTNWTLVNIPLNFQTKTIAIDPNNPNRVWLSYLGTTANTKVFKTENGGTTWTNVSGSLPNISVTRIKYQKGSNDALYIATDLGVYYRNSSMNDWIPFNNKLPNVRVQDIKINQTSGRIIASTYGRSIWSSPLHPTSAKPLADFKAVHNKACKGMTVQFKNYSPNTTSYSWSFPGGTPSTSTAENPSITYANGGTYSVTLTTTNTHGSSTFTRSNYIDVSAGAISSFPYIENFDSFTVGNPGTMQNGWMNVTYDHGNWIVHKGKSAGKTKSSSGSGPNADHTSGNGNYLIAEQQKIGWTKTAHLVSPCFELNGVSHPTLEFYQHVYGMQTSPTIKSHFSVDLLVDGKWIENVVPEITSPIGDHWVKQQLNLTAHAGKTIRIRFRTKFDNQAIDWAIDDFKIFNNAPKAPVTDFTGTPTTGEAGVKVSFSDNSSNIPTSWSWSFPNGTPSNSTVQNPKVVYNTAGKHKVVLTTTNAQGSNTKTKTEYINVTGDANLISNNTVTSCTGTLFDSGGERGSYAGNENFVFTIAPTNATSVSINTANWTVGANDVLTIHNGTSVSAPVLGTYSGSNSPGALTANTGAMTFKFKSSNAVFSSGWKMTWSSVGGSCGTAKPVTAFTANTTTPEIGAIVQFTDQSTNTPTSWLWNFPGGTPSTSTAQNPSVTYATAGSYQVTLTATNAGGNGTLTKNEYITVKEKITKYNMSNKTVTACTGTLYDSSGATANYSNDENYTFVINPTGADKVTINFNSWAVENSYDFLKIYNGTSASGILLGSYSGTTPGTVVANSGAMTLVFTSDYTENRAGWEATWTCSKNTNPPVAAFTASKTTITKGESVVFTDTTTNKPTSWAWNFEGGTPLTSSSQNPTITYNAVGTYKVTLTAINAYGSDPESKTGFITVTEKSVEYNMSNQTVTSCTGTLLDSGGKTGNYSSNENYTFVINPAGASAVTVTVNSWEVEDSYDFLEIYNGTSVSGTKLGSWSGTSPGAVTANSGAITLNFKSDYIENRQGFNISWTSNGGNCGSTPATTRLNGITKEAENNHGFEKEIDVKVYPVPVKKSVIVELNNTPKNPISIVVLDNLGREITTIATKKQKNKIDTSLFNSGIYYIKVIVDDNVILKRITKN